MYIKFFNFVFPELLEPPNLSNVDSSSCISADSSQTPENDTHTDPLSDTTHDVDETEIVSGTMSSPDISDHELQNEETSHDDSAEHIVVRERRDSGVGSSLTRTNRYGFDLKNNRTILT